MNIFNLFCSRQKKPPCEPDFAALGEMSNLEDLRAKPRRHVLTAGFRLLESDLPFQVPVSLGEYDSRGFQMVLAAETPDQKVIVRVTYEGTAKANDMWLSLNYDPVGHAIEIADGPKVERKTNVAVFAVPPGVLRDGRNNLIVRCENTPAIILAIDVIVT